MLNQSERHFLSRRLCASAVDINAGVLALLIQHADESMMVPNSIFPLRLVADREIDLSDPALTDLVSKGVIQYLEEGVIILADEVVRLLASPALLATNTTSTGSYSGSKKTTITEFIFEDSSVHARSLAFVPVLRARVRAAIAKVVADLDFEMAQMVVHEVGAQVLKKRIKGDAVTYAHGIVRKARAGKFVPAAGLELADELDSQIDQQSKVQRVVFMRAVK